MPKDPKPVLKKLTPVLVVDRVEPCLSFWTERFGFAVTNQVPGPDGTLVFASVFAGIGPDSVEVMYQTRASVEADLNEPVHPPGNGVALFISVEDLDAVEAAVAGAPVVKPRHTTFYGSTEIYVREPGGFMVGFAEFTS
jgi:uncharacterized glyoxalase superfamily protein PhnB